MRYTTDYKEFLNSRQYDLVHSRERGAFRILIFKISDRYVRVIKNDGNEFRSIYATDSGWCCGYRNSTLYDMSLLGEFL